MNAASEPAGNAVHQLDIAQPLRHRGPGDAPDAEPTGELLYPELAEPYLAAARAAFDDPTPARYRAAEEAAFWLATRYTSMDLISQGLGGSPREAQAGWALTKQARAFGALAAQADAPTEQPDN